MRLDKILENIKAADTASEKTAGVTESVTAGVPRDALIAALNDAGTSTKVASAPQASPVDALMKIASDVAATEQEMAVKEAQLLGRAFADAVVARVGEWQSAAAQLPATKTASAAEGFDKFAAENPDIIKQAAELVYTQTRAALEKFAADEYSRGYNDTLVEVQKLAAAEFAKASIVTRNILDSLSA